LNEEIDDLKLDKENILIKILKESSDKINSNFTVLLLKEVEFKSKKYIYKLKDHESFYCVKQLQYNIKRLYKVKQSDRYDIVSGLKAILDDSIPKRIFKIDIKSFYESISFDEVMIKIEEDGLLSFQSRKILKEINEEYKNLS
jgi:hypothetical protein